MEVKKKLVELLSENFVDFCNVDIIAGNCKIRAITFNTEDFADILIAEGVTIKPAVPGPASDDPNITELCFHNGEQHMKERVISKLMELKTYAVGIQHAQLVDIIKIVEGL